MNISIVERCFIVEVYDKRDDFPFNIVQYAPKCSNMSRDVLIGVFGSQLVRFFRICNLFEGFRKRVELMLNAFIKLGFDRKLLSNKLADDFLRNELQICFDIIYIDYLFEIPITPSPHF